MCVKRYDREYGDYYDLIEKDDGPLISYEDYAALHEAVAWERECEDLVNYLNAKDSRVWLAQRSSWLRSLKAARAEVDRLLEEA